MIILAQNCEYRNMCIHSQQNHPTNIAQRKIPGQIHFDLKPTHKHNVAIMQNNVAVMQILIPKTDNSTMSEFACS